MQREKTVRHAAKGTKAAVPEKQQDMLERVRKFAYSLYEKRGYVHGNDRQDWFEAEKTACNHK